MQDLQQFVEATFGGSYSAIAAKYSKLPRMPNRSQQSTTNLIRFFNRFVVLWSMYTLQIVIAKLQLYYDKKDVLWIFLWQLAVY